MDRSNTRKRKLISHFESEEPPFDEYVYCENCYDFVYEYCSIHGPLLIIPDNKITSRVGIPDWVPRAALTTPRAYVHIAPSMIPGAGLGVFSSVTLPRGVRFGPYQGKSTEEVTSMYCWQIRKKAKLTVVDGFDGEASNWMRYVNCARNWQEQNLIAFQYQGQIYYRTIKIIPKFTELLVYCGSEFANGLGIDLKYYSKLKRTQIAKWAIKDLNLNGMIAENQKGIYKTETLEVSEEIPRSNNKFDEISHCGETEEEEFLINSNYNEIDDISNFTVQNDTQPKICNEILNCEETTNTSTDGEEFQKNTLSLSYDKINNQFNLTIQKEIQQNVVDEINCDETTQTNEDIKKNTLRLSNNIVNHQIGLKVQEDNPKICGICNKIYKTRKSLWEHKWVHKEPRYCCTQCSFKTYRRSYFNEHKDRHTKHKVFKCELCSYVGYVQANFRNHLKRVHKDETYKTSKSLREHQMVHKEPRYCCTQCSYKTSITSHFNVHKDRHTKHKAFQCELCSYVGYVQADFRSHLKRVHKDKTSSCKVVEIVDYAP